ncbi:hypothetical protein [Nocardia wallacei]|uniref:hypothetical protein n=1 Tax=Nocardia wallacei TaxID=480035 RepID=UPI00245750D5|nr:hypothetical protein [Nocardia wallacei]
MSESEEFNRGGIICGDHEPAKVSLAPDECVWNRDFECIRGDHDHPNNAEEGAARRAALDLRLDSLRSEIEGDE